MDFFKRNKFGIILVYINSIFIISLFKKCYDIQDLSYVFITVLFVVSLLVYFVFSEVFFEEKKRFYVIISILVVLIFLVLIFRENVYTSITKDIVYNIVNINELVAQRRPTFFSQYKYIVLLVLPPIVMIFFSLAKNHKLNFIVYINLVFMMFFYYIGYEKLIRGSMISFMMVNIIALGINEQNTFLKYIHNSNIRNSIKDSSVIFRVISSAVIIAMIINVIPLGKEGKYQSFIEKKMMSMLRTNGSGTINESTKYDLSYSGYSDSSKTLGGSININKNRILRITGDYKGLYLRGSVRDYYDGNSWQDSFKEYNRLNAAKSNEKKDFLEININQVGMETSTLFSPLNTTNINLQSGRIYKDKIDNSFLSEEKKGNVYTIEYTRDKNYYDEEKNEDISIPYLQLPLSITDRTKELTRDITKGKSTNYEKAMAIKDYLERNYTYSTTVGENEEKEDFIDYFLFTEKKGYCVYFASALTIMSRIAGVPARYVEGFKIGENIKPSKEIYVTNEDAHAWSEVLIDEQDNRWISVDASTTISEQTQGTLSNQSENTGDNQINPENDTNHKHGEDISEELNVEKGGSKDLKVFVYLYLIAALITCIIFRLLKAKAVKKRLRGYTVPSDIYYYCLRRLRQAGIEKKKYMTDLEFAYSIKDDKLRETIINLVECCYKEYYGGEESYIKGEEVLNILDDYLKKHLNKVGYFENKYFKK